MPQSQSTGPHMGQTVIYTETATTFYPALIVAVNTDGTVRLTTFPPGASPADQNNIEFDYGGTLSGSWRYPDPQSGI